jgi:kynurenine formamidase
VDLTHELDESTHAWPGNKPFVRERTAWGETTAGYWYASGEFSMSEHAGTHMDAPIHFARDQASVDTISLDRLVGSAVVVDVRKQVAANRDYRLSPEDLRRWEAMHGPVPAGSLVFMLTGWDALWTDRQRYFGSNLPDDPATLHFPGFDPQAVQFLVTERAIRGIGIDTASVDYGPSKDFPVHRLLNGAGLYALENVAHLDQIPAAGTTVIALPLKIKGGSGGPVRIIAVLP